MDARTTPFTRLQATGIGYRAERDMLEALTRGDAAGERVLGRLLRALGHEPVGSHACAPSLVPSEHSHCS
jgi:hypothetical protein